MADTLHPDHGQRDNRVLLFVLAILIFGIAFTVLQHRQATAAATGVLNDLPVLKYSWHTFLGSSTSTDGGLNLGTDSNGKIYLVGISNEEWLGPSGQAPLHAAAGSNIVIVKLDKHGAYQWHTFYAKYNDFGIGVALDGKGGVYITGKSYTAWLGDGNTDPIYPFFFNPLENYNMLVLKLSTAGAYQWHAFFGAGEADTAWEAVADGAGGVYVAGTSGDWKLDEIKRLLDELPVEGSKRLFELWKQVPQGRGGRSGEPLSPLDKLR